MAKNVVINGVIYNDIPYVKAPKSDGSGDAIFPDTDSGDVSASDIRAGKKAWAKGQEFTGTQPERAADDISVSGKNVTVPAGIYDEQAQVSVPSGSVTPAATMAGDELGETVTDYPVEVTPTAAVQAGYVSGDKSGSKQTKYIQVETKKVTPSMSKQNINATAGKLIQSVEVDAVPLTGATATPATVPAGVKFYGNSLELQTGTAKFPSVSQDPVTKVLTIS